MLTNTLTRRNPEPASRERKDRLLAFKALKVLMLAIDWYLSSVRWGERMHNHNYRGLWSLIYSWFIFVDAFHLYSLALWSWKDRFPFTLLRSDAACCHKTFVLECHFPSLCIHSSIHKIHISGKLPWPLRILYQLFNINFGGKLLPHQFSQILTLNAPAKTLLQFHSHFIIKWVSNIQREQRRGHKLAHLLLFHQSCQNKQTSQTDYLDVSQKRRKS